MYRFLIISEVEEAAKQLASAITDHVNKRGSDIPFIAVPTLRTMRRLSAHENVVGYLTADAFAAKTPSYFLKLIEKYNVIPVFITNSQYSMTAHIFHVVETVISTCIFQLKPKTTNIPDEDVAAFMERIDW